MNIIIRELTAPDLVHGFLETLSNLAEVNLSVEQAILPHLDAAYNLARWLTATDEDAEDVLQETCLRAIKFFPCYQLSGHFVE